MENINLIRKVAWSFHKTTGIEFDELMQEASLAYLEANKCYDCTRGKFTSFCWMYMVGCLKNYIKTVKRQKMITYEELKAADKPVAINFLFEKLTPRAQHMVDIILRNQNNFIPMSPGDVKRNLVKTLRGQGWGNTQIWAGFTDIHKSLV